MAEREGFEPPCRLPGKTLSRRPRYDHFGTSPNIRLYRGAPPVPAALAAAAAAPKEEGLNDVPALNLQDASGDGEPVVQLRRLQGPHRRDQRSGLRLRRPVDHLPDP